MSIHAFKKLGAEPTCRNAEARENCSGYAGGIQIKKIKKYEFSRQEFQLFNVYIYAKPSEF